jgi:nicotinamidase-related amidase
MAAKYTDHITPDDCALVLVDFQPQMFFGIQSHDRKRILDHVQILAKGGKLFDLPVVLTTITASSFAGPFVPEVAEAVFPDKKIIDRTAINAWIDPNFRAAIQATGRKRIVIAGLWTGACATFPTLELLKAGYEVFVVTDACGDTRHEVHEMSVQRMIQAGAVPLTTLHFLFELQQDWAREETYSGVMEILRAHDSFGTQIFFSYWALGGHAQARDNAPKM